MKLNVYGLTLLTFLNLVFPALGLFAFSSVAFIVKLEVYARKVVFINMTFSLACIAFFYERVNGTGDVVNYIVSYENYANRSVEPFYIANIYEAFYVSWYYILYIFNKLNFEFQSVTSLAVITIFGSLFFINNDLYKTLKDRNSDRLLLFKVFLFFSFFSIVSSYKTLWAFSLVYLGIYQLCKNKKIGYLFIFLGAGFHPIASVPILVYFVSKFIEFKKKYLVIALCIGVFIKVSSEIFVRYLNIPFIGDKIQSYVLGEWANYRFHENGEYIKVYLIFSLILCVFYFVYNNFIDLKKIKQSYLSRYCNFALLYFSFSLIFVGFRTLEIRLMSVGIIFLFPLFYVSFSQRTVFKKKGVALIGLLLWFAVVDVRLFNFSNSAYLVGKGLPVNIFISPVIRALYE
ncbi:EpsG family protein [Pseudoalteromonas nigrifaciens]|uniref:EpsG family protein n=1 Tax=Pseudoalteromonas nigrifaciens TaxID=28109 RepID=UPI00178839A1|nr:EpsG family protein [Pseudoalteromonas nigrifaciens]MBE0421298.1 EpsG family protein [Pseudoalteromonas nigrifaciens]